MKYVRYVICSLLLAVFAAICIGACSNDAQDLEFIDEEDQIIDENEPDIDDKDPEIEKDNPDDEEEPIIIDPEIEPPEFLDFSLISKKEIHFYYSSPVNNVSCTFTPFLEIDSIQTGKTVIVILKNYLEEQTDYLIELKVNDDSLSIEVPLFVENWIPKMEINELRPEASSKAALRAEFIEFKVKSAGNLDGMQLCIMWDVKKPFIYNFPAVEVKLGEYVVLHLRTWEDACVDELGDDLSESGGKDSSPEARDLWVPDSSKLLHKTDIVYLQDAEGNILDAVVLNETPGETWNNSRKHFTEILNDLYDKGAWKSADGGLPGTLDAVDTSTIKTAYTKSICRYEGKDNTHTANDWYIGGATPGQPNK
jgi:hypothetical protein